jgi:integrase
MHIPEDVRDRFQRKQFTEKMGEWPIPYYQAAAHSSAIIAKWNTRIEFARNPRASIVSRAAADAQPTPPMEPTVDDLRITIKKLAELGTQQFRELRDQPHGPIMKSKITGFLDNFDTWSQKSHLRGKTLDQAKSDVRTFAKATGQSVESLSRKHVQTWIEGQDVSAATIRRKLTSIRGYWDWLISHELAEGNPFTGTKVRDARTTVERKLDKRQRFEPAVIQRLIEASQDDPALNALIQIAAYTGARREGIASLTKKSVIMVGGHAGIQCLSLSEKTEAGIRTVPIHSAIKQLIHNAVMTARDGYLIQSDPGQYGYRGDALGKRFTRLKIRLGFNKHYVFHSIRHTVVHLFKESGCPIDVRNQIMGHEPGSEEGAGGGYGGHVSEKLKLEWLEKALRYP